MSKRNGTPPKFDIGDWIAYPMSGGQFRLIGRVVEYDSFHGRSPRRYGFFAYPPDLPPEYTWAAEDYLQPATPEEIAAHAPLAAQEHPRIFRDPHGPRR